MGAVSSGSFGRGSGDGDDSPPSRSLCNEIGISRGKERRGEERREEGGKRRERRSLSENWLPQKEKGWMEWEDEKGRGGGRKSKYAYSLGDGVA